MSTALLSKLQQYLEADRVRHQLTGAAVAVYWRGQCYLAAGGQTSLKGGAPCTPATPFPLGCLMKLLTATLLVALADDGVLDLDVPLEAYLPPRLRCDPSPTLRQVLGHADGMDEDPFFDAGAGPDRFDRYAARALAMPRLFAPGYHVSYGNVGYILAVAATEYVLGKPWEVVLPERLLARLGVRPPFGWLHEPGDSTALEAYDGDGAEAMPQDFYTSRCTDPAGNGRSKLSVEELLAFARLHLANGRTPGGATLVGAAAIRGMRHPAVEIPGSHPPVPTAWAEGWAVRPGGLLEITAHTGGSRAAIRLVESLDLAIVTMATGTGPLMPALTQDLLASIASLDVPLSPVIGDGDPAAPFDPRCCGRFGRYGEEVVIFERQSQLQGLYQNVLRRGAERPPIPFTLRRLEGADYRALGPNELPLNSIYFIIDGEERISHVRLTDLSVLPRRSDSDAQALVQ